jgi:hypothetical protein
MELRDEEIARDEERWRAMVLMELRGIIYGVWLLIATIIAVNWPQITALVERY